MSVLREVDKGGGFFFFFSFGDAVYGAEGEWIEDRMMRRLGGCWRGFYVRWVVKGEVEPGERRGGMEEV